MTYYSNPPRPLSVPPVSIDPIVIEPNLLDNPAKITSPTAAVTVDAAPRPAYLAPLELTGYGTKITRIGGDEGATTPIGGLWTKIARHGPGQFWNDDMTMMGPIVQDYYASASTTPYRLILDGSSYQPIMGSNRTSNNNPYLSTNMDFRWRPGYPKQAVTYHKTQKLFRVVDMVSQASILTLPFSGVDASFGMWGDSVISSDGRFVVLCTRIPGPQKTGRPDYFIVIDIEAAIAGGQPWSGVGPITTVPMTIITKDSGMIDWCGISPLGNYVVIKYGIYSPPEVARCFTVNKTTLACAPRVFSAGDNPLKSVTVTPAGDALKGWMMSHSRGDLAVTAAATLTGATVEVLVGGIRDAATSNYCSNAEKAAHGKVVAQSLLTGKHMHVSMGTTQLSAASESDDHNTSARCYKQPQVILHTYAYHASNKFADEMVLWPTELNGGSGPIRCGTTRTDVGNGATYYAFAHASPSPNCEKIVFSSNWQRNASPAGPAGDYKSYILEPISVAEVEASDYAPVSAPQQWAPEE